MRKRVCARIFLLLIVISLLLPLFTVPEVHAPASTVYEQATSPITRYPNQRKTFYANSRYWMFYQNTTAPATIYYRSSLDGVTWNNQTSLTTNGIDSWFATWLDEDNGYVYYTATLGDLKYRRGMLQQDGTIVWSDAEYTIPDPWIDDWWYLRDTNASIAGTIYDAVNGTYGTTNSTTEVVIGTASVGDLFYIDPFENTTSSFGTTEPGAITRKGWRTSQFTKSYTHGGWTPNLRLITRATVPQFKGRIGIRIWNDTNADLSTATVLKDWTWLDEKTYTQQGAEVTTNQEIYMPDLTMTNEYMYFECIFNVTDDTAGAEAGFFLRANDIYARVRANRMKQYAPISAFNIAVDSSGYPHIIAVNYNGFNNTVMLAKAQFNNGSWGTTTWTELKEDDDTTHNYNCALIPLQSDKLLAIYQTGYNAINTRFYDGSWNSEVNVTNTYHDYPFYKEAWATSSDGSTIHMVFNNMSVTGDLLRYSNWTEGSGWSTPIPVGGDTSGDKTPSVSLSQNGTLYAFWSNSSTVKYKRFNGAWDSTVTTFETDSGIQSALTFQTSYLDYGSRITVSWISLVAGSYRVRFSYLAIAPYRFTFHGPFDETTGLLMYSNVTYENNEPTITIQLPVYNLLHVAQTFTPQESHDISLIILQIYRVGTGIGTLELSIRNTTAGKPDATREVYVQINSTEVSQSWGAWHTFYLETPYSVISQQQYALVLNASSGDASNHIDWLGEGNTYAGGAEISSNNGGSTWQIFSNYDHAFREVAREIGVEVTAYYDDGTEPEEFVVRGIYVFAGRPETHKPLYFRFGTTEEREYWLSDDESTGDIYIFDDTLTSYTIEFVDLAGALDDYPFVEAQHYVNGTLRTVEKRKVDEEKKIGMYLVNGRKYTITVENGASYVFGDLLMTSTTLVTLSLRGIDFPQNIILAFRYVRLYSERHNNFTSISMLYEDLDENTNSVNASIYYQNGTIAYSSLQSADSFNVTWTSAWYNTTYVVRMNADHGDYGTMPYRAVMYRGGFNQNPWGLSFLGSISGMNTSDLIPMFLILACAGLFSKVNAFVGAFMACMLALLFMWFGWFSIAPALVIAALFFALLMGLAAKRRYIRR